MHKANQQTLEPFIQNGKVNENNISDYSTQEEIILPVETFQEPKKTKLGFLKKIEAFIGKLSIRNNFWNKVCSLIWLPFAFSSGLMMTKDENVAILPFRRFNKNWYNAMAGAILLGNSEIASGTYVFKKCKGLYRVVCKKLEYRFLLPCIGPAIYKMTPRENIEDLISLGNEFNIDLDMNIYQLMYAPNKKQRRVGKCTVTFHATPITSKKRK